MISTLRGCYPNKNWWFQRLVYLLGRVVSWKQGLLGHNWKISWAERVCNSRWQECYYCSGRTEVQQQRGSSFLHFSSPTTPNTLFVLLALLLLYRMTVKLSLAFKARKNYQSIFILRTKLESYQRLQFMFYFYSFLSLWDLGLIRLPFNQKITCVQKPA